MSIAENIKELRKSLHITQKELAEMTGLSIGTIQGYEQGRYEPKMEALERLREALSCSFDDLMDEPIYSTSNELLYWLFDESIPPEQYDRVLTGFNKLNDIGRHKATEQVEMLTKIPEYQKEKEDH